MKVPFSASMRKAWDLYRRHFGRLMLMLLIVILVGLMPAVPCVFLFVKGIRWGAVLVPVLFVLLILPFRQNVAAMLNWLWSHNQLDLMILADPGDYGRKLLNGLKTLLLCVCWLLPFIAATVYLWSVWHNQNGLDSFTVMRAVRDFGGGSLLPGLKRVLLVYFATLLPFFFGLALHSGRRHAAAIGSVKAAKGRHGTLLLTWLVRLCTMIPPFGIIFITVNNLLSTVADNFMSILGGTYSLPLNSTVILIAAAAVLLLLPFAPLRALMTAVRFDDVTGGRA